MHIPYQQTTPQRTASSRKLRPSGKRPEKMAAAESKSTLDLLPDLAVVFGQSPSILN